MRPITISGVTALSFYRHVSENIESGNIPEYVIIHNNY